MAINTTIREQLEQMLRESPEVLARIIGSAMDPIIAIDDAHRIVVFNAAAEKLFRCPANEAMGNSIERFIPQRFRAEHDTRVRRFDESGVTNRTLGSLGTVWGLRATGEEFPIEVSISKVESGGKKFFTAVIRDITERQRVEEEVRESEQRFRLVADTAPVLIWMSGTDKLCTYFNKPWLDFTGRSVEQELGNGWAEGVHPDDLQRCVDTYQQSFDRREKFRMEYRLRHHDGEYRWILDIGVPRFNQGGSFAGYIGIGVDVTERKKAEESSSRLAAIVESSNDAILALDANGTVTDWNKGAEQLFGYSASEAVGKKVFFLSAPDHSEETQSILKKVLSGEAVERYETVRHRKDGSPVEISLTVSPIFDAAGRVAGMSGIVHDITERKMAENRLREYEKAVEGLEEMLVVVDREYRYLIANRKFLEMRQMTKEQVEGHFATEVLNKGVFEASVKERLDECFRGKVVRFEMKYAYPALGERDVSVSYFPIAGKTGIDRVACIAQDITERKRAEEAVKESEQRFRLVANAAPVMIWMSGLDKKPTYFNQPWLDFTGLSETDLQNRLAEIVHPEDYQRCYDVYCRAFDQRQPFRKECRLRRHDGRYRWMLDIGVPRFHNDGSFAGYIGSCIDVTEQKQAEAAISTMTRKLVEAQEQERARIARELHDDINQRLAMLAVELEQLKENPSEIESRVEELRKETTELSNDVQALSHELHSSKLEYLGAIGGMKSWCKEFAERQKIEIDFRTDVRNTLPAESGLSLFRVLQEALHNAVKHSDVKRIEVELYGEAGEIHLTIRDLGKGFDIEAARQGRGLGLTSMQERVRLLNGTIVIESKPMGGTSIHVRVPLESDQAQRAAG